MKKFEAPAISIEEFEITDVISASGDVCDSDCPGNDCTTDTGCPVDF